MVANIKIVKPERKKFNLIEKRIRKNVKVAIKYLNTEYSSALTCQTSDISNDFYLTKVDGNKTILDILLEKHGEFFNFYHDNQDELLNRFIKNSEIIEIYLNHEINIISFFPIDKLKTLLSIKINEQETLLEYMLNNKIMIDTLYVTKEFSELNLLFYDYFMKCDNIYSENFYIFDKLLVSLPKDNTYELLNKHFDYFKENIDNINFTSNILYYLIEKKEFNLISNISKQYKDLFISKYDDNNTFLDYILKINPCFKFNFSLGPFDKELNRIFIKNGKFDIILKDIEFKSLLFKYDNNKTYLDIILENFDKIKRDDRKKLGEYAKKNVEFLKIFLKQGFFINFLNISDELLNQIGNNQKTIYDEINSFIIFNLKFGGDTFKALIKNVNISNRFLLQKYWGFTLLEHLSVLLDKNSLLNILTYDNISNVEIQTILRFRGINWEEKYGNIPMNFDINEPLERQKNEILKDEYEKYYIGEIEIEEQLLLDKFKEVFENDGKSSIEVIELAYNSFKMMFINKNRFTNVIINKLIEIKTSNPQFILKKDSRSYFFHNYNCFSINVNEINAIGSFLHELGHFLHFIVKDYEVPNQFKNLNIIIDYDSLEKLRKNYLNERRLLEDIFKQDFYKQSQYTQENEKTYIETFSKIIERYRGIYSDETLEYLQENFPIEKQYRQYYNEVVLSELVSVLPEITSLGSLLDIIDALTQGEVFEKGIEMGNGEIRQIGHGKEYYSYDNNDFIEIFAQYFELINFPNDEKYLQILESIVGSELIELLNNFYNEMFKNYQNIQVRK